MDDQIIDDRIQVEPAQKRLGSSVKDLKVYQRAYEVSLAVHCESLQFPKIEQYALADQMRRASKSICANLSEGFTKQHYSSAEFGRFISMAVGSAGEMQTWIEYGKDLGYITAKLAFEWQAEYLAILMLQKLRSHIH